MPARDSKGRFVRVRIVGDDDTKPAIDSVKRNFDRLDNHLRRIGSSAGKAFVSALSSTMKLAGQLAAVGSAALTIGPPLIGAGLAMVAFVKSVGNALPALAALAASAMFVKLTIGAIAPAIVRHMKPIADAFDVASQKASFWATRGIRPLAKEWAKVGMPIISRDMSAIAREVNLVIKGFLGWAKSTTGLNALSALTSATARAMHKLGPAVQGVATSFAAMLGRISEVSIAAGSNGLVGVLDKLNARMDKVTGETVAAGLKDLKDAFDSVRRGLQFLGSAIDAGVEFWFKYQEQIDDVRTALALLAIAFGGPVGIAIGAASLIQQHWSDIKPVIDDLKEALGGLGDSDADDTLKSLGRAGSQLKEAWDVAVTWIKETLWPLIKEQLPKLWRQLGDEISSISSAWDDNKEAIGKWISMATTILIPLIGGALVASFKMMGGVITATITVVGLLARAFVFLVETALGAIGPLINAAAKAFGWVPGIGPKLEKAAEQFNAFRDRVNESLAGIRDKNVNVRIRETREFITLHGREGDATGSRGGYAHGGIVGAATGGIHGGLRLVGEQGPELVSMAPGSRVTPAGATKNMLQGAGQNARQVIELTVHAVLEGYVLKDFIKKTVTIDGSGSVQEAFGS